LWRKGLKDQRSKLSGHFFTAEVIRKNKSVGKRARRKEIRVSEERSSPETKG